jgi:hypothetical protein
MSIAPQVSNVVKFDPLACLREEEWCFSIKSVGCCRRYITLIIQIKYMIIL